MSTPSISISQQVTQLGRLIGEDIQVVVEKLKELYEANYDPAVERYIGTTIPLVTNSDYSISGLICSDGAVGEEIINYNFIFSKKDVADIRLAFQHSAGQLSLSNDDVETEFDQLPVRVDDVVICRLAITELVSVVTGLTAFPAATTFTFNK